MNNLAYIFRHNLFSSFTIQKNERINTFFGKIVDIKEVTAGATSVLDDLHYPQVKVNILPIISVANQGGKENQKIHCACIY